MDIKAEKNALIRRVEKINDLSLIKALRHMVDFGIKNSEGHVSLDQYNKELDEAEAEIERGEYITHEDLKKQMKEW